MLDFLKKIFKPIADGYKKYTIYWIIGIGSVLYIISIIFFPTEGSFPWKETFAGFGKLFLASAAFAAIAKSHQFTEIFNDELRKVIYSDEHLEARNDLETIWEKVTKALCNQRFDVISSLMQKNIKKDFLPIDHDYYYSNYKIKIYMEYDPNNKDNVIVKETNKTYVISEEGQKFDYSYSVGIDMIQNQENETEYELQEFTINGKNVLVNSEFKKYTKDGILFAECKLVCEGKQKYTIQRKELKKYNLNKNCHRSHTAVCVYNNCELYMTYPKDLEVEFFNLGTLQDWKVTREKHTDFNVLEAKYTGLIYRNQGFMLFLNKN